MNINALKTVAIDAATQAATLLKKGFYKPYSIKEKTSSLDVVTEYDKASELLIKKIILESFPDHGFICEESGPQEGNEIVWVIDPLDGTLNFTRKIPNFTISIAAVHKGRVQVGVVLHPFHEELYVGVLGQGSTLNDDPIHISDRQTLDATCVSIGLSAAMRDEQTLFIESFRDLIQKRSIAVRRTGTVALDISYVAAGRIDAFVEPCINAWDVAAASLILQEAGGVISRMDGLPIDPTIKQSILAASPTVHQQLLTFFNQPTTR